MHDKHKNCSRRQFLKLAGAAGVSTLAASQANAIVTDTPGRLARKPDDLRVPTRPFGKSGRQVSILALGGMFDIAANQLMLKQALKWGITYWDTADCYHRGSERGIGKYFSRYPADREKVFLVTKSDQRDSKGMSRLLERSLERLNTAYIDLYFIHGMRSIGELSADTRRWAERAKADGKIKLFGFSTHRNMEELLKAAAGLGWIDGIMMTYNFRNMHTPEMKAAVDACVKAGIGLTAMKTQANASWFSSSQPDLKAHFMSKGFTEEQAKLKAVWTHPHIASICSQMDTMKLLKANTEAAAHDAYLSSADMQLLRRYALETAQTYCAGCGHICSDAVGGCVPVSDVMRYHMYSQGYGRPDWSRSYFSRLDTGVYKAMAELDFSEAERRCPRKMPIGKLMRAALDAFL